MKSRQANEAMPADRPVHLRLGAARRSTYRYNTINIPPRSGNHSRRGGQRPPEKQAGERSKACRPLRTSKPRRSPTKHLPLQHNKYPPAKRKSLSPRWTASPSEKQAGERSKACRPPCTSSPRRSPTKHPPILILPKKQYIPAPKAKSAAFSAKHHISLLL